MRTILHFGLVYSAMTAPMYAQSFEAAMAQWFGSTQAEISAVSVLTKQKSTRATQNSSMSKSAKKAAAYTMVLTQANRRADDSVNAQHDPLTSGGGLCDAVSVASQQNKAFEVSDKFEEIISLKDSQWNAQGGNAAIVFSDLMDVRSQTMCSEAEVLRGLCSEGSAGFPAGDTNSAVWLSRRSYGTDEAVLGSLFIDQVATLPTMKPLSEAQGNAQNLVARLEARLKSARLNVSRGSLSNVVARGLEGGQ